MCPSFFQHLHPLSIPAPQAHWRYTLGSGGIAGFLVLVLIMTGVPEIFFYIRIPEQAVLSVHTLTFMVLLGGLVRDPADRPLSTRSVEMSANGHLVLHTD